LKRFASKKRVSIFVARKRVIESDWLWGLVELLVVFKKKSKINQKTFGGKK
jgi:hypothetical protein